MLTIIVHVFNMEIEDGVPMISCLLDMAFGGHLEFGVLNGGVDFFLPHWCFLMFTILSGNLVTWYSYADPT